MVLYVSTRGDAELHTICTELSKMCVNSNDDVWPIACIAPSNSSASLDSVPCRTGTTTLDVALSCVDQL